MTLLQSRANISWSLSQRKRIHNDSEKIAAILNMPSQQATKQVHSFLGVLSWYRRFVPNFTELAHPLYNLVKKGTKLKWNEETEEATKNLKKALTETPILTCPDFEKTFVLQTDASNCRLGKRRRRYVILQSKTYKDKADILGHRKGVPGNPLHYPRCSRKRYTEPKSRKTSG